MSIQDIANVVNELNKNLVRLAEKVAEHDRELADIEFRLRDLERVNKQPMIVIKEAEQ